MTNPLRRSMQVSAVCLLCAALLMLVSQPLASAPPETDNPFVARALEYLAQEGIDTDRVTTADMLEWQDGETEARNRIVVVVRFMRTRGYAVVSLRTVGTVITYYSRGRLPRR